ERILEYRDESQRLDQCTRLYDSSVSNEGFELDASHIVQGLCYVDANKLLNVLDRGHIWSIVSNCYNFESFGRFSVNYEAFYVSMVYIISLQFWNIFVVCCPLCCLALVDKMAWLLQQELGGISTAMERQKALLQELMSTVKDMLRNTEVAVRSFMMLRPRFVHSNTGGASNATAPSQAPGPTTTPGSGAQPTAASMVPVFDFYHGLPKKPSPFLQYTVARFEKYLGECRQWIEELEQLLLLNSDRNSINHASSLLQSLPKVMSNVHDFFVHVAAKVESIHQYIESMKTAYLADHRHRGDVNDPFLEADRRETAKQEAAAKRVHPTLHLPANSQPSTQVAGLFASSAAPAAASAPQTSAATSAASSGGGLSLFSTPSSTPASSMSSSLFATPTTGASIQTSLFSSSSGSLLGSASTPSLFASTVPAFGSTASAGGAPTGSGASFGAASVSRMLP
ncbi:hypothetical protein Goklo_008079, partial [Gossypium klotzschianum]|nr:hypothetical protein [Gossypium klotzschianum]